MGIPVNAQYVAIPIFNQLVPDEGPKSISLKMSFDGNDRYTADMLIAQESGIIKAVQTIYIDASKLVAPVSVIVDRTQQTITVKPKTQGYYPLLAPNPPIIEFVSQAAAGSQLSVNLLNVPMPIGHWTTE